MQHQVRYPRLIEESKTMDNGMKGENCKSTSPIFELGAKEDTLKPSFNASGLVSPPPSCSSSSSSTFPIDRKATYDSSESDESDESDEYSYPYSDDEESSGSLAESPAYGTRQASIKRPASPSALASGRQFKYNSAMQGVAICVKCGAERHCPVDNCTVVADWLQKRRQLPTLPGAATVQFVMDSILAEVGSQAGVNNPWDICEEYGWNITALRRRAVEVAQNQEQEADDDDDDDDDDLVEGDDDDLVEGDDIFRDLFEEVQVNDGAQADEAQADEAQADGAQADGAQADGAQADGAQAGGPQADEAQVGDDQVGEAQAEEAQVDEFEVEQLAGIDMNFDFQLGPVQVGVVLLPRAHFEPFRRMRALGNAILRAANLGRGAAACAICLEDNLPADQVHSLACGDNFCRNCWHEYLNQVLRVTPAATVRCPQGGCALAVREPMVQNVAPDLVPLFRSRQREIFVSLQLCIRWCPGPDCNRVAFLPGQLFEGRIDESRCFECEACSTAFCFQCGNGPHDGVCEPVDAVPAEVPPAALNAVIERNPLFSKQDDRMRKQCPRCNVNIEKNGGCNRMTCRCGHAFCWLCLGDYATYSSHKCTRSISIVWNTPQNSVNLEFLRATLLHNRNLPLSDELQEANDNICALERFAYYYNRYDAHDMGQRFAEGLCPCLQRRADTYSTVNTLKDGDESGFFVSANETLVLSRRLLKYAYCSAYHSQRVDEEDAANYHLGFHALDRLERFTEELSEVSENALTRLDRMRVMNLIAAVKLTMGAVEDFELEEAQHRRSSA